MTPARVTPGRLAGTTLVVVGVAVLPLAFLGSRARRPALVVAVRPLEQKRPIRRTPGLRAARGTLTVLVALSLCASCRAGSTPALSVRLATTNTEVNALIPIAQERGYFERNGIEVIYHIYPSGVAAIDGMFAGEADVATGSEFAFVGRVLADADIRAIAVINRSSVAYIVARVDRHIRSIGDLRGKTIGVPLGSRPEFALDRFLLFHGVDTSEVTLVDVPVNRSVEALVGGQVDAVAAWQPYIDEMREAMGSGVVTWSAQEGQPSYTLLVSRGEWAAAHDEELVRFLTALVESEKWFTANPAAAMQFFQEQWGYSEAYVSTIWPDHIYSVLLDQTLIVAMEDQARWLIERDPAGAKRTPYLIHYIYFDALETVRPEAVNVIR